MNDNTQTLPRGMRALDPAHAPVHPEGTRLVSVAEVMLATAAATAAQPTTSPVRGWWVRYLEGRERRRRAAQRRPDCFEAAAMAREMHRL
ncbi:MAG: hypothetical protein SW019_19765 [Actinomycetota bacterium]|nr:hypothetical protein [Actinomycetota bacterium]